jgi:hypothetical protein
VPAVPSRMVIDIPAAEQARLRQQWRRARWGGWLTLHILLSLEPAALADRDCRLAVLLTLDRVGRRLGLAARKSPLGNCRPPAPGSHPDTPAKLVGFAEESTVRLRLVPPALEWCGAGRNTPAAAWLARVGGNGAALAARLGLGLEVYPAGSQRQRPAPDTETGPHPPALGALRASASAAVCR